MIGGRICRGDLPVIANRESFRETRPGKAGTVVTYPDTTDEGIEDDHLLRGLWAGFQSFKQELGRVGQKGDEYPDAR